jgi:hypothetical protein
MQLPRQICGRFCACGGRRGGDNASDGQTSHPDECDGGASMNAEDDQLLAQAAADAELHRRLMEELRNKQKLWAQSVAAPVSGLMALCALACVADSLGFWKLPKLFEAVMIAGVVVLFPVSIILMRLDGRRTLLEELWKKLNRSPALEPPRPIPPALAKFINVSTTFFGLRMILHLQVVLMVVMVILLCIIMYRFF